MEASTPYRTPVRMSSLFLLYVLGVRKTSYRKKPGLHRTPAYETDNLTNEEKSYFFFEDFLAAFLAAGFFAAFFAAIVLTSFSC